MLSVRQDVTIQQPMSSVFTPPASCSSHWTYEGAFYNSITGGVLIQNALQEHPDTNCFPAGFKGFGRANSVVQVYSPGACPAGYSTAGNSYANAVTTAICCPSAYTYSITYSTIIGFSTSAPFAGCISSYASQAGPTTVLARADNTALTTTTVSGPILMWAQPISVAYESSDETLFTTTKSSTSASLTSASSSTPTITSGPSMTSSPLTSSPSSISSTAPTASMASNQSSNTSTVGLSSGAIAGIAVAAAVIMGGLIGLAILFRRKKSRPLKETVEASYPSPPHDALPYPDQDYRAEKSQIWNKTELQGSGGYPRFEGPVYEMPGQEQVSPKELSSNSGFR